MSLFVLSPNMDLPIPIVGQEPGPDWASDINACLTLLDAHDHTPGSGVQITTQALDINADLTMNVNMLTSIKALVLSPNAATPAVNMIYEDGVDLYFMDGDGNPVRITQSGAVAGTPGSIANLVAPASATYVGANSTFVWESDVGVAADMDFGSAKLRNLTPNSTFALTLSPPAALSSNYQIVLPTLPSSQKIMTLDNSGNMTAPYVVDDSTITIISNVIQVKDAGITLAKMAANSVDTSQLVALSVTNAKIANSTITSAKMATFPDLSWQLVTSSTTVTVPAGKNAVILRGIGGGGGGGGGGLNTAGNNTTGGGGGASGQMGTHTMPVVAGETLTITVGAGGTGGTPAPAAAVPAGTGAVGGTTTITASVSGWTMRFVGGAGGPGGSAVNVSGGASAFRGGQSGSGGGGVTTGVFGTPSAGDFSALAAGGAAGTNGPSGTGGAGGAGGFAAGGAGGQGNSSNGQAGSQGSGGGGGGASTSIAPGSGGAGGNGAVGVSFGQFNP